MHALLSRITIAQRIYVGFGLVLALMIVLAGFGYNGMTVASSLNKDVDNLMLQHQSIMAFKLDIASLRRKVLGYVYQGGTEKSVYEALETLNKDMDALNAFNLKDEHREKLNHYRPEAGRFNRSDERQCNCG